MMKAQRFRPLDWDDSRGGPLGDDRLKRELHWYDVWLICEDKKEEFDWSANAIYSDRRFRYKRARTWRMRSQSNLSL